MGIEISMIAGSFELSRLIDDNEYRLPDDFISYFIFKLLPFANLDLEDHYS